MRAILQRVAVPEVYRHIQAHGVRRWSGTGHVAADAALGFKQRLVIPIRHGSHLLAHLMIIDEPGHELRRPEVAEAEQVAVLMARVLERDHRESVRHGAERVQLLDDLFADNDATRERAVHLASETFAGPTDRISVMTLTVLSPRLQEAERLSLVMEAGLQNLARRERSHVYHVVDGSEATIISVSPRDPGPDDVRALGRRALEAVESLLGPSSRCVVGLPAQSNSLTGMPQARRQSRLAAEAASLLPGLRPVAGFADLGAYAVLLRIPREELEDVVPPGLRRLLESDSRGLLRETLEVYLAEAGSVPATADRLSLHRTSLYYRLGQIRDRLGLDLRRGEDRLVVHLGLRALAVLDAIVVVESR
ncbi:CdaR family transcriptional regulator [Pseudonocardia sp. MH-G8]|uniref:PucR family transcriptional regulator n=1 Tax=Pseudonocardia sp. MH-G8 TaxID=1854588 RepID=UPI00117AD375|nr:PucR family transcriptional regulator [Pseudonocardia sp. MH-G8]